MVFVNRHLYVTLNWSTTAHSDERGQTGFRCFQSVLPDSTDRATIEAAAETMWESAGMFISNSFILESVKWALIEPSGLYPSDVEAIESFYGSTVAGGVATTNTFPLQAAHAVTLTTAKPRGRGSKGRMYFPPIQGTFTNGLYFSTGNCLSRANALKTFLDTVNATIPGEVSVFSAIGTGIASAVTGISVGQRIDVQRRRARQADEGVRQVVSLA